MGAAASVPVAGRPAWGSGWSWAVLALLIVGAGVHFAYLASAGALDLSGDEAHYWEWSRRLDWSYYSKGPLVAWIIAVSRGLLADWSQQTVGSEALAVRVPALLLSIGTGGGLFVLARAVTRSGQLALATVAGTLTIPIFAVGPILMTIDAPLAFLYVWTLVAVERGLRSAAVAPWIVAGVLSALGILAKYTMVLVFPAVLLAAVVEPRFRAVLRRPGPYAGVLIGLAGFVPILIWNAQHDWVSFRHVAGQAGLAGAARFQPLGPLDFVAGQLAVVGPIWFGAMVAAVVALARSPQPRPPEAHDVGGVRLLLAATVVPWAVFLAFSIRTKTQPNWPLPALLPGTIVMVCGLARLWRAPSARARRWARVVVAAGVLWGGTTVIVMHRTEWALPVLKWLARREPPWNLTPVAKFDPTARLRGWSELGRAVGEVRAAERAAGRDPFIVTDDYQTASEIAFYAPGQPRVYCLQAALGDRQSQYDLWRPNPLRDPEAFVGRPCVYVGARKPRLFGEEASGHVALPGARLARTVEHAVEGRGTRAVVQVWSIYVCEAFAGLARDRDTAAQRY